MMLAFLTRTTTIVAAIAIAAILLVVVATFQLLSPTSEAHTIADGQVDKEIVLCAIDTLEQLVAPDNDLTPGGITNTDSWTFVLIDATDIVEVPPGDDGVNYPTEFHDLADLDYHADINGQPHSNGVDTFEPHYNCILEGLPPSAPGPSITVNRKDVVRVTLVNDIDNEHVHSLEQHAISGDEHTNSGPVHIGHKKTWIWKADQAGSFLYHSAGNGLVNIWTDINNGMYGNIVVQPSENPNESPAIEYSVMFADMYLSLGGKKGDPTAGTFDFSTFITEDNLLEVTNGQAFNYAETIGADWGDGDHAPITLNPINFPTPVDGDFGGMPILAPVGKTTRLYITNPGPNQFLAWHFIAGQMDVRDGSTPSNLMTPVKNEETWTVPPGSSSITETVFPSTGPYVGVTHKLSDIVKGGAFVVVACDVDDPANNAIINGGHPLSELLCITLATIESIEDIRAFNAGINPKVIVNGLPPL